MRYVILVAPLVELAGDAARMARSRRSVAGAALGAVVGTALGFGIHSVLDQGTDRNLDDGFVIPIFTLSQGTIAAAGSRLLGR